MWFIILLVLAVAAYFIVKAVKAQSQRNQAELDRQSEGSGLAGSLNRDSASQAVDNGAKQVEVGQPQQDGAAQSSVPGSAATGAAVAGVAAAGAAAVKNSAVTAADTVKNTAQSNSATAGAASTAGMASHGASSPGAAGFQANAEGIDTGDTLSDVREMIKILNLAEPDASRLAISREQFTAVRQGSDSGLPTAGDLSEIATKLRHMLA